MANSVHARKQNVEKDWNQPFFIYHIDVKKPHNKKLNNERDSAGFFVIETYTTMRVLPSHYGSACKFVQNQNVYMQTYLFSL
jgi:hypothetical protein